MKPKETGIPCWMCHKRSGLDCPGRKPEESTLCTPCFIPHFLELRLGQERHLLEMLNKGELTLEQFYEYSEYEETEYSTGI